MSFAIQLRSGTWAGSWQVKSGETTLEFLNVLDLLRWPEGLGRSGAPSQNGLRGDRHNGKVKSHRNTQADRHAANRWWAKGAPL